MSKKSCIIQLLLIVIFPYTCKILSQSNDHEYADLFDVPFQELLEIEISTASGIHEKLADAPATVIVIEQEQLVNNGYYNLLQVLQDLPGMDVIVSYGDTPFTNYWRGYRNDIGAPYILLIDGINFNNLYYNYTSVLVTLPVSNIDHIEIVYGPVSSVYGANAFMGVINIVTISDLQSNGNRFKSQFTKSNNSEIIDFNSLYKKNDFKLSVSTRLETSNNFPKAHNNYEWTKDKYLSDHSLWGDFATHPSSGGAKSAADHNAFDIRAYYGNTEIALQLFQLISGTSMVYPFDRNLPNTRWYEEDKSIYLRQSVKFTKTLGGKTLIRYRESNIPNKTYSVSRYSEYNEQNDRFYNAPAFEYWQALNSSWEIEQNFSYIKNNLSIFSGFNFEHKDLQKSYDYAFSTLNLTDSSGINFPEPPSSILQYGNRFLTKDKGVYLQSRYQLFPKHLLHFGFRHDHNSLYHHFTTIRSGYHYQFSDMHLKLLYGEGYNEPNARVLYGGWAGTGSDSHLNPESSKTFEMSVDYQKNSFYQLVSIYRIYNRDTILNYQGGARNAGERDVFGIDVHLKYEPTRTYKLQYKFWFYYSYINATGYEIYNENEDTFKKGDIGDIAKHKAHFGMLLDYDKHVFFNLSGRYLGKRNTVYSNPVTTVDGYMVMDANIALHDIIVNGIHLSLRVNNLFDKEYYHPGMRDANAGITPGYYDERNEWIGSKGWYNSLLPQMGREFYIQFTIDTMILQNKKH